MKYYKSYSFLLLFFPTLIFAQVNPIKPPSPGELFPDITLPVYQGGTFSMAAMKGKNVILIASRGRYADDHWCAICNYQYADFVSLAINDSLREKYNLEIVFLMPYSANRLADWENSFPQDMAKIENWKFPKDTGNITPAQKEWADFTQKKFPKSFTYPDNTVQLILPVLCDSTHEVSTGLDLFRTEWDGGKTEQNIPAVYIIDDEGVVQFKYISQNTFDRPASDYLIRVIEALVVSKN